MFEILTWSRDGKVKKDGENAVLYHIKFGGLTRAMPLSELGKFIQNVMPAKDESQPETNHHTEAVENGR